MNHGGRVFEFARERAIDFRDVLDFSASINPLGPSPRVIERLRDVLDRARVYPHEFADELAGRLSEVLAVRREWILPGNGATDLIFFWLRVMRPRQALLFVPTFSEYRKALRSIGCATAVHRLRPEDQFRLPRFVDAGQFDAVILTNPNNPSGAFTPPEEMAEWLAQFGRETNIFLDEAFVEFTAQPSLATQVERLPNLWVLRSMTKFHAIPGLRAGFLAGSRMPSLMLHREPWQVNALAEAAALAALEDQSHRELTLQLIQKERLWFWKKLWNLEAIEPFPTAANFYLVRCRRAGDLDQLQEWLRADNILIRDCRGTEGLDGDYFRFAIRTRPENERLIEHMARLGK